MFVFDELTVESKSQKTEHFSISGMEKYVYCT